MSEAIPSPLMATPAMPMGLEGNFTLNELPFYVYPDWNPECIYWTVYTSLLFVIIGIIILLYKTNLPHWFGFINISLGIVSTLHHMRSYKQTYEDWLRLLDLFVAILYGVSLVILFGYSTYITFLLAAITIFFLKRENDPNTKCKWHALFHLIIFLNTLYQVVISSDNIQ